MKQLFAYRGFIFASVKREFQLKYRNSLLGVMWTIINPLSMIFIYTVIFSRIMHARLPGVDSGFAYGIYLCSGIITWYFFAEVINRCIEMFVDNAGLIKKLTFPRLCLPIIVLAGSLLNFAIIWALFTVFICCIGQFPGWPYLAVPFILLIQISLAMGIGTYLGILNVFFRDVGQFFTLFLQIWFWLTPIVYATEILPLWVRPFFKLNPMTSVMDAYHAIFIAQQWPAWESLIPTAMLGIGSCLLAFFVFHKRSEEMVDEL